MFTLKFLAPILFTMCAEEFLSGQGDYCVVDNSKPHVVKYYEPGKSCYANGIFYPKCEDRLK